MGLLSQLILFILLIFSSSCRFDENKDQIESLNWTDRQINYKLPDSMQTGTSYLSVYSQIYNQTEHKVYDLTATVSIRNTDRNDTIYLDGAEYFDTKGHSIRKYFNKTVYVAPMETVEIVIEERDEDGGTGANFIFDWRIKPGSSEPLFEGVMITSFGQGLSFTTHGKKID
ncbi:DUF3124 domain-containing protein [Lutimonas zeaxanthinifaciens]|nr:DUF3124 domain-containing protein [Lutimonas sp. YSD2104]WKK67593.1 DUF3124 domain-containing protein [Lutimonas sp. YSD2104]